MSQPAHFSALSVALSIAEAVAAELSRIGQTSAPAVIRQARTFENLAEALRLALPDQRDPAAMGRWLPLLKKLSEEAEAATLRGLALPDLLELQGAIPRGSKWRPFPVTLDSLAWLGIVSLIDALRVICHRASATPERRRQLATLSDLQAALSAAIEVDPESPRFGRIRDRLLAPYAVAAKAISDQMIAIRDEAQEIRRGAMSTFLAGWIPEEPCQ